MGGGLQFIGFWVRRRGVPGKSRRRDMAAGCGVDPGGWCRDPTPVGATDIMGLAGRKGWGAPRRWVGCTRPEDPAVEEGRRARTGVGRGDRRHEASGPSEPRTQPI